MALSPAMFKAERRPKRSPIWQRGTIRDRFRLERLQSYGLVLTDVSADVAVNNGTAKIANLKAALDKAPLTGSAEFRLCRAVELHRVSFP